MSSEGEGLLDGSAVAVEIAVGAVVPEGRPGASWLVVTAALVFSDQPEA